jgi:nucleoside-diphosphate-sugar epimerase
VRSAVVTGAAGFIGNRVVERMLDKGWYVYGIDDYSTHNKAEWPLAERDNLQPITAKAQDVMWSKFKDYPPEVIIHLAGKVGPLGVIKHSGKIAMDTIELADKVSVWAYEYECPLIDISTSEVYGDDTGTNSESDPTTIQLYSARSEYAVSKLASEHMLLNRVASKDWEGRLDVRIVRPFNIAGRGQRTDGGFVLPRFIKDVRAKKKVTIYKPGTQQRAFTHIDDFVDGLALVYQRGKSGEIYNLGNERNKMTMFQLAEEVFVHANGTYPKLDAEIVDPKELHGPDFREAPDKIPDSTKARTELGWKPYRRICRIIEDMV